MDHSVGKKSAWKMGCDFEMRLSVVRSVTEKSG